MTTRTAIAIAAHPDDIEFTMAGTLLLLKRAGWEIHYFNLANGNGGSTQWDAAETAAIRLEEARDAAEILGATWHAPIADDLCIFYNETLLRKVSAVIREVQPSIVLTHPLSDYMEDHMNTARLAVSGAFARGIPNFGSEPPRPAFFHDVTVYHSMPHGGLDPLRRRVPPSCWVNVTEVQGHALSALYAHRSQQNWLDSSQGINNYLDTRIQSSQQQGADSGIYQMAEGWVRHLHTGFSNTDRDPLSEVLDDDYHLNPEFDRSVDLAASF